MVDAVCGYSLQHSGAILVSDPKSIAALYSYDPQAVPLDAEDMPRYMEVELRQIQNRLNVLCDTFMPSAVWAMNDVAGVTVIPVDPARVKLVDWSTAQQSDNLSFFAGSVDLVNGELVFDGDAGEQLTVEVSASLNVANATLPFNEEISLVLFDGVTEYPLATQFITSNLQTVVTLNGSLIIEVLGNARLSLELFMQSTQGNAAGITGTFSVRPVTFAYVERPLG